MDALIELGQCVLQPPPHHREAEVEEVTDAVAQAQFLRRADLRDFRRHKARLLTWTLAWSGVLFEKIRHDQLRLAPRQPSTMRTSVVDSSRQSSTIGSFLSANSSPIFSMIAARTTEYGIEVMTMRLPSRRSLGSLDVAGGAQTQRAVAGFIDLRQLLLVCKKLAAGGKSGPRTKRSIARVSRLGSSMSARRASSTSPALCGGIEVAMPTAMPWAPLIRRLGSCASTIGSKRTPSKLGRQSVVPWPSSWVSAAGRSRHSITVGRWRVAVPASQVAVGHRPADDSGARNPAPCTSASYTEASRAWVILAQHVADHRRALAMRRRAGAAGHGTSRTGCAAAPN